MTFFNISNVCRRPLSIYTAGFKYYFLSSFYSYRSARELKIQTNIPSNAGNKADSNHELSCILLHNKRLIEPGVYKV